MFKKKPQYKPEPNSVTRSIKERIKVLGRLHRQGSLDLKISISALADLFAFRRGHEIHKNPKDKRKGK